MAATVCAALNRLSRVYGWGGGGQSHLHSSPQSRTKHPGPCGQKCSLWARSTHERRPAVAQKPFMRPADGMARLCAARRPVVMS